jgi:glycosyltransferase involved in cell wall biosynthesis
VIPYRDNRIGLTACLKSIADDIPVIVVDDVSAIAPSTTTRENVQVIRLEKRGYFAGAVNAGIKACDTDVLVLNQDVVLKGKWLEWLAENSINYAMIGDGVVSHPAWPTGYVQGTFMFIRRDAINAVGLLDEVCWPLWGGTCEWQIRAARKGFKALPQPSDGVWFKHARKGHYGSSIEKALQDEPAKRDLLIRTPPLISVIVPSYNHGKYAQELWDSLLAQTFQGFDCIIVDDCSPDDSWKTLQKLSPNFRKLNDDIYQDDRIGLKIMRLPQNGGTSVAVNAGVRSSYGKYIMVMDGDDMLVPNALERFLTTVEANPDSLIYCNYQLWANGKAFSDWIFKEYDFDALTKKNFIGAGVMFSRASFDHVGGYPEEFRLGRQDWAWAVKMGMFGHCGVWLNELLYIYRREGQNRVLKNSDATWMEFFQTQMRTVFPQVYDGGTRPMGCCGGRGSARLALNQSIVANKTASAKIPTALDAPGTMVMLEFIGKSVGRHSCYGDVTRIRYVYGAGKKYIYVDSKDVPGMLSKLVDHRNVFKAYAAPKVIVPTVVEEIQEPKVEEVLELKAEVVATPVKRTRKTKVVIANTDGDNA